MKKYFGMILTLIGLLGTSVFATYEDFSRQLETMGLDVQKIEAQTNVSRYDLARLLNMVECKDCIHPNQDMLNKYIQNFWSTFTVGKDFTDISFGGGNYNNASYYYCVAYVGDNTYMRGYPKATSPVCGGQFCGTKDTTTAEFIQVVINILAKYIYKDISLNRKTVNTRVSKLKVDSYEAKNFNSDNIKLITEKSKTCDNTCALQNNNEVNLYLKYCMFNLAKCTMQEVGKIKQGYWPVAELNLLYSQNIINIDQTQRRDTAKNIDGKTVLETLFKLNGKVNCAFNNDYDCDGLDNAQDSCPNTYNPSQKDFDKDGIGDVCDDDIDNDGIKNPIDIIDEEGKIDISKWIIYPNTGGTGNSQGNMDNCLFVVNTNQEDIDHNGIGDACENINGQIGLYINIDKLEGSAPLTTKFTAMSEGNVNEVQRDFGDGTQGKGTSITHTFLMPGMYNIQAIAKGNDSDAKAQVIVIVGGQIGDNKTLQTRASVIGGNSNTESVLSTSLVGNFDEIEWIFEKENNNSKKAAGENFKKIFKQSGENPVLVKGYSNGELAGISYFTIGIDEGKGAILKSNNANPEINEKILLDTTSYNIIQSDIVTVDRDFGDGNKKSNTTLTIEYIYTKPGKKIITQTITLIDGTKLTNIITINVIDKTLLASYALLMIPSKLIANVGENINFTTRSIGTMLKKAIIQIEDFGDGITEQKAGTEKLPSLFIHTYQKNGALTPQDSMYIDQCTYLNNQATIAVNGTDACLDAKIQGTLKNYKCDLDGDGIPDICDTDIDGDGIKNLLGLINFENKDCSYRDNGDNNNNNGNGNGNGNNNGNGNLNQGILGKHYQGVCSLDNASFKANPDQLDLNQDGIGDIIQNTTETNTNNDSGINNNNNNNEIDTDGDGIPDIQDLCPIIKETWNGITDTDGCPEVGQEITCNQDITPLLGIINDVIIVKPSECNQCPCQFGDFASDLTNNDQVRAILRDNKKTIQYRFSLPWIVNFQQ